MNRDEKLLLLLKQKSQPPYYQRLLGLFSGNIVAYWPLYETSGSTAADISGNGRNGSYTGVDLANADCANTGTSCPYWDGTNDYCNVYSTSLRDAYPTSTGTMLIWLRVSDAGVWTDGVSRYYYVFNAGGGNLMAFYRTTTNNQLRYDCYMGATYKVVTTTSSSTSWLCAAMTWSKAADEMKAYLNGSQVGTTQTGLGTWSGTINTAIIGAGNTTPGYVWKGWLGHAVLLNRAASASEIAMVYNWGA